METVTKIPNPTWTRNNLLYSCNYSYLYAGRLHSTTYSFESQNTRNCQMFYAHGIDSFMSFITNTTSIFPKDALKKMFIDILFDMQKVQGNKPLVLFDMKKFYLDAFIGLFGKACIFSDHSFISTNSNVRTILIIKISNLKRL